MRLPGCWDGVRELFWAQQTSVFHLGAAELKPKEVLKGGTGKRGFHLKAAARL